MSGKNSVSLWGLLARFKENVTKQLVLHHHYIEMNDKFSKRGASHISVNMQIDCVHAPNEPNYSHSIKT
jgi:hypothetical protein